MAPEISAAVTIANVAWKAMKRMCGMVPPGSSPRPTSLRARNDRSPSQALPVPKASEYPMTAHVTPSTPSDTKLIIIVLSAFFERTSPP